jgi:hypothetical protein
MLATSVATFLTSLMNVHVKVPNFAMVTNMKTCPMALGKDVDLIEDNEANAGKYYLLELYVVQQVFTPKRQEKEKVSIAPKHDNCMSNKGGYHPL